jgi:hypothetical protein
MGSNYANPFLSAMAFEHGLANTVVVEAELREGVLYCVRWGDEIIA